MRGTLREGISATRACDICGEESWVGYGADPQWLCLEHFQEALSQTKQAINQIKELNKKVYNKEDYK